jgi:xanthine dehydrogenase accessory factor
MRDLLAELTRCLDRGRPLTYCADVDTRGSTPQKAGAAMLVFADGTQAGTLGGGCVEAEVKRRALHLLDDPAAGPEVASFSLDDDYGWDDGLICGGRMTMLVAPLRIAELGMRNEEGYYGAFRGFVESGVGCTEVVALPNNASGLPPGARYLFDASGSLAAQLADLAPPADLVASLKPLAGRPRPFVAKGFAHLPVLPRITLLIVGGGHVGQAVAALAATVDFEVWVVDDREKFVGPDRFPAARRRLVGDIGVTLRELKGEINSGFYCLIVTRGHNHDEEALYHLARTDAGYVGMIGSRRKIRLIFDDLIAKGIPEEVLANAHAPLGLPIGSQTVPEIAISIVAELIERRNTGGTSRKGTKEEKRRGVPN